MATITGTNSADTITTGETSDKINSGNGDDTIDGGGGNDTLNAGNGSDTLIYTLAQNTGNTDLYTGGAGIDTVRLQLTNDEWLSTTVQTQIHRYVDHLSAVKMNNQGEVSNGLASDFTFYFDNGTKLTVSMMEKLDVWVGGQQIDFNAPFITVPDGLGSVIEDTAAANLSASRVIHFTDVNWTDTHTVTVTPSAGNTVGGTLTASLTDAATGDGSGQVTWTYVVANSNLAVQGLGDGDVVAETFTVTVIDSAGKQDTQIVTITITGDGDAPVITAGNDTGAVAEDGTLVATGNLDSTDVDIGDDPTWSAGAASYGTAAIDPVTGAWTYTLDNTHAAVQGLGEGDILNDSFLVTVTDEDGLTDTVTVNLTITGTNDAAIIAGDTSGSVTEATATSAGIPVAMGTLTASDIDNDDNKFQANSGTAASGYGVFTVESDGNWTYTLDNANAAVEALNNGEQLFDSFTVLSQDGTAQVVNIEINGATDNQAPTNITLNATLVANTLPNNGDTLATLSTTDADVGDTHTYSLISASPSIFSISGNNLNLTANLQNNTTYNLVIQSTDASGATFSETFNVITGNGSANDLPPPLGTPLSTDDILFGLNGADMIFGGTGDDTLFGQVGADVLNGGDGNDVLVGGADTDVLTGGNGADKFVFNEMNGDRISDFLSADDVLDFQQSVFLLANGWTAGDSIDSIVTVSTNGAGGTSIAGADLVIWDAGAVSTKDTAADIDALLDLQAGTFNGGVFVLAHSNIAGSPVALYYDGDANDQAPPAGEGATLVAVFTNYTSLASLGLPTITNDYTSH
jgi:VCBS repeat-containing protein